MKSRDDKPRRAFNSTLPARTKPMDRGPAPKRSQRSASEIAPSRKPVRKVNKKRKAATFARCFHSIARAQFVASLPCLVCGIVGYSSNCHTANEGKSRKGHYTTTIPLCEVRPNPKYFDGMPDVAAWLPGHHRELDAGNGREAFEAKYGINLVEAAAQTELAWQSAAPAAVSQ